MIPSIARGLRGFAPAAFACSLITLAGCSNKDNPVDPSSSAGAPPKAGSLYTYQGTSTDALGRIVQDKEYVTVVVDAGISFFGKNNLVRMSTNGAYTYYAYEANGDLSVVQYYSMNGVPMDSTWVSYPFGSKKTVVIPTVDLPASGMEAKMGGKMTYLGSQQVTVAGETFATEMVRIESDASMIVPGQGEMFGTARVDTMWYAPRIGYLVKQSGIQTSRTIGSPDQVFRNVATLKSYKLQ